MGKRKVQVVRRIREVYEFEVEDDYTNWEVRDRVQQSINSGVLEEAKDFNLKLLDKTNLDTIYPIGDNYLNIQTHKENMLILDELMRIWSEYPREDFNSTIHEIARTIHEECSTEDYAAYLPDDFNEKYFENIGTKEEPEYVEKEDLWSERWDVEYRAIHNWIREMGNDELLKWMKSLIEFIGY